MCNGFWSITAYNLYCIRHFSAGLFSHFCASQIAIKIGRIIIISSSSHNQSMCNFVIDREAGEIIRLLASVRLSVRPFVCLLVYRRCMKHKSIHIYHYQSNVFVCVSVISCCFDRERHRGRSRF